MWKHEAADARGMLVAKCAALRKKTPARPRLGVMDRTRTGRLQKRPSKAQCDFAGRHGANC
jgi:hypothetical protein